MLAKKSEDALHVSKFVLDDGTRQIFRISGEYFKRVNFSGKGNTHLKWNIEVAHVE